MGIEKQLESELIAILSTNKYGKPNEGGGVPIQGGGVGWVGVPEITIREKRVEFKIYGFHEDAIIHT